MIETHRAFFLNHRYFGLSSGHQYLGLVIWRCIYCFCVSLAEHSSTANELNPRWISGFGKNTDWKATKTIHQNLYCTNWWNDCLFQQLVDTQVTINISFTRPHHVLYVIIYIMKSFALSYKGTQMDKLQSSFFLQCWSQGYFQVI